jgi:regulator of extracellular matrix RemA (YlzA/DUF370 family)
MNREGNAMDQLINIGFGNYISSDKIVAVVNPDSAPAKRLVQNGRDKGTAIDATQGRKTRSVVIMENGSIVLSAIQPETISARFSGNNVPSE